jgi:hypothetical protein
MYDEIKNQCIKTLHKMAHNQYPAAVLPCPRASWLLAHPLKPRVVSGLATGTGHGIRGRAHSGVAHTVTEPRPPRRSFLSKAIAFDLPNLYFIQVACKLICFRDAS